MPQYLHSAAEIMQMSAAQQITAYADRLDAFAQGAELARLSIPPIDLRKLATEMRQSARNLPASGIPAMAASGDGATASPALTRDLANAGLSVRRRTLEQFNQEIRPKNLPSETTIRLKLLCQREGLLVG